MSDLIFEKASRTNLRFESSKGLLSVEDLWNLPLTSARGLSLDELTVAMYREVKMVTEAPVSFVAPTAKPTNDVALLKFDILKHIIDVRVAERDAKAEAESKRMQKQRLREVLERRQNAEIELKTPAEIQAMIDAL